MASSVTCPPPCWRSSASMSSWPLTARRSAMPAPADPTPRCQSGCAGNVSAGMRRDFVAVGKRHELAEHGLELAHQRDDTADDLSGEVLVALRQQHSVTGSRARGRHRRARVRETSARVPATAPRSRARASHAMLQASSSCAAPRAAVVDQRPGLSTRSSVRCAASSVSLTTCVRRLRASGTSWAASASMRASSRNARSADCAVAVRRFSSGIELDVELRAQTLERAAERGLVVRVERALQVSDVRAITFGQRVGCDMVDLRPPPCWRGSCRSFP